MGDAKTIHCHFCEDDGNLVLDARMDCETFACGNVYQITIWPNFECDGASIPRVLWRLCGHPLEYPRILAAVPHDWLYKSHILTRREADAIYREILTDNKVSRFRAFVEWFALRLFGWVAWMSHDDLDNDLAIDEGRISVNGKELMP